MRIVVVITCFPRAIFETSIFESVLYIAFQIIYPFELTRIGCKEVSGIGRIGYFVETAFQRLVVGESPTVCILPEFVFRLKFGRRYLGFQAFVLLNGRSIVESDIIGVFSRIFEIFIFLQMRRLLQSNRVAQLVIIGRLLKSKVISQLRTFESLVIKLDIRISI